jgi:hypothetical protein
MTLHLLYPNFKKTSRKNPENQHAAPVLTDLLFFKVLYRAVAHKLDSVIH